MDFYLATAACAYQLENPGDRAMAHLAPTTHPGLVFAEREPALEWLFAEAAGLLAAVRQGAACSSNVFLRRAIDLLFVAQDLMESGLFVRQYEQALRMITATAHERDQPLVEGRARLLTGRLLGWSSSRFAEADAAAQRAQLLGRVSGDLLTCSYAPNLRGLIAADQHRYEDAAEYYQQALDAFRADDNSYGEAAIWCNLSFVRVQFGQASAAVGAAEEALTIYRRLGGGFRLANGLYKLGIALTASKRFDEAMARLGEALAEFRSARQQLWEGLTLFRMAEAHLAAGCSRQAATHADQSLVLLSDNVGDWRKANVLTVLGHALTGIGQSDRARACWHEALTLYSALGSKEADEVRGLLDLPPGSAIAV